MVTHHFADLFQKEPETLALVHAMEKKVYEFSTFLTEVAGVEDVGARMEEVVTFHDGCHALRELGIKSRAAPPAGPRERSGVARDAAGRRMLRLRRHVLGEIRRAFGRHGAHQDRSHRAAPARAPWCASIRVA